MLVANFLVPILVLSSAQIPESKAKKQSVSHNEVYVHERFKRSDSKFETLKRREREQRLIESGVYTTQIASDTPDEIRVHSGERAVLPCRVVYLGTQSVIWSKGSTVISIDHIMMNGQPRLSGEKHTS